MSFESLLGNEQLKKNLESSIARGQFSHCYLISGPQGSGKHTLAKLLAAALVCQGEKKPCLSCHPCRKVMEGIHPDVIVWEDPEHKTIPVKMIREVFRPDVFVMPNESERKVYLIPQELGVEGQNALLKVIEEPPSYAVFLLMTDNPDKLLPTVRSRCRELKLTALPPELLRQTLAREFPTAAPEDIQAAIARSGGFLGQAKALLEEGATLPPQTAALFEALCRGDGLGLTQVLPPMEKWKRDQLSPMLESWLAITAEALACRAGSPALTRQARDLAGARTAQQIHGMVLHFQKALAYAKGNVSPGAVCGWLTWALRE